MNYIERLEKRLNEKDIECKVWPGYGILIYGDNFEISELIEFGSVDLVYEDWPFGLPRNTVNKVGAKPHHVIDKNGDKKTKIVYTGSSWDEVDMDWFAEKALRANRRILKDRGGMYIYMSDENMSFIRKRAEKLGFSYKATITWYKMNPSCFGHKKRYISAVEYIGFMVKGTSPIYFECEKTNRRFNFIMRPVLRGNERLQINKKDGSRETAHPTQKPIDICKHHINISCLPGGVVKDGVAGMGTTGIATIVAGENRQFILIEKNKKYYERARSRINKFIKNSEFVDRIVWGPFKR